MAQIRRCPDCAGKGRHWVPLTRRTQIGGWSRPDVSPTACGFRMETLPEYRVCGLCLGTGKVSCETLGKEE